MNAMYIFLAATFGWFLFAGFLFMLRGRGSMKLTSAVWLGLFTLIFVETLRSIK